MNTRTYKINGLDCAEEISALKATVGRLPGIQDLDFNLLNGTMTVQCVPGQMDNEAIHHAIRQAGLSGEDVDESGSDAAAPLGETGWRRHRRTVFCWLSGAFVLSGFLTHAFLHANWLHALTGGEGMEHHEFPVVVMLLYGAAVVTGGWLVAPKAWAALRHLRADMNLLMAIAVIGAIVIGQWFEAGTVSFLFALSLLLESWSVNRARRAIHALVALTPPTARCLDPHSGTVVEHPVAHVGVGTTVLVRPGERIPLDGTVTKGRTAVNQAPITGESLPVAKAPGDDVFAGTINEAGAIELTTTKAAADTTLSRIIRMVEQAQARRAPVEQWVERFARVYTPAMIVVALAVAVIPPLCGGAWARWFYEALVMLVIACPCALVISTPVSIVAGLTAAARMGVLIKGGAFLEAAARVRVFALDKTGTLTRGVPEVQEVIPLDGHTRAELLARAAAIESHSAHPLARAILNKARQEQVEPLAAESFLVLKGRGAEAVIDGRLFWVGSHRFLHDRGVEESEIHDHAHRLEDAGHSVIAVGNERHVCGVISVADAVRPEAPELVRQLKVVGIRHVVMLTGDNQGTAAAVGRAVGVDEVRAELLPEDKMKAVQDVAQRHGAVAMVGDGINDAPALATATIGIAMGAAGSDAAVETADIALMSDDLAHLPWLVNHAHRALGIIRQNIAFALGAKAVFMALALAQMATLWMAIAADMGVSLLVIFNALRLLNGKRPLRAQAADGAHGGA